MGWIYGGAALLDVSGVKQSVERYGNEIRVGSVAAPICISATHRFGNIVDGTGGARSRLLVPGTFQHPENLKDREAARAGWRCGDHFILFVAAPQRRSFGNLVALQIVERDQPTAGCLEFRELACCFAFVKLTAA